MFLGEAEVKKIFDITVKKAKTPVAGSLCTSGVLEKSKLFRVKRDDTIIYEGKIVFFLQRGG